MTSDPKLKRWYNDLNKKLWKGQLRSDVTIWWEPCGANGAETVLIESGIEGEPPELGIKIDPFQYQDTGITKLRIAHEQIHVFLWPAIRLSDHGTRFDEELQRLTKYKSYRKLL